MRALRPRGLESSLADVLARKATTAVAPQLAPLTVSRSPEAGGAVRGAWPPDGADAVDAEMSALFVAFDGAIEDPSRAVRLRREGGEVVATDAHALPCADAETWPDGLCAVLRPRAPLAPGSAPGGRRRRGQGADASV